MNSAGPYTVRAYRSRATESAGEGCDYDRQCDTLSEARKAARYALSAEFARLGEMSAPFGFATVHSAKGECVFDVETAEGRAAR